jgi:hypothetical protein
MISIGPAAISHSGSDAVEALIRPVRCEITVAVCALASKKLAMLKPGQKFGVAKLDARHPGFLIWHDFKGAITPEVAIVVIMR